MHLTRHREPSLAARYSKSPELVRFDEERRINSKLGPAHPSNTTMCSSSWCAAYARCLLSELNASDESIPSKPCCGWWYKPSPITNHFPSFVAGYTTCLLSGLKIGP